ncbi:MAG: VapC toxin family PIN domain ribonuclease [Nostoc sp. DedQUE08]|uniref:VapC toxin family PIN domain ribonuclease n=1 Tax=unclassified Nostoc TaxID=2593658 RepID=UPI002AD3343A|nr:MULTISPECIES: VapC toxin family PIN domain ribonuclease [unclassified Nostoc]MDZ8070605.1 VapC toxin family PIN domain ribonuclease [Nostoc sp. DedQUE08]MDZ8092726.1 VapC toxin family PIN domain ribonuclease [Nostoc sp. DedQUE05]
MSINLDLPPELENELFTEASRLNLPLFASLSELPSVPGFVVMELIQDSQNKQQLSNALKQVAPLPVVWATEADLTRALSDFTTYHFSHSLGLLDALIAACAVGQGATLCTSMLNITVLFPVLLLHNPTHVNSHSTLRCFEYKCKM